MWAGASAVYINGVLTSSGTFVLRYGEWIHVVFVLTTPFNTTFEIGDDFLDGNIGLVAFYPTALTAANALSLYDSYNKIPLARVDDTGNVTVADAATPVNMYAYNWESQNA
jgi:hypothetical protein